MTIDKDKGIEELGTKRFERDLKLQTAFRDFKKEELEKVKQERTQIHTEYMGMAELQGYINDAAKFRKEIDEMHVKLAYQSITINELETANETLLDKKETLDKEKKETAESNEDQTRQLKAKEEANQKRLIAKLQRDKNPTIKELIQK